MEDLQFVYDLLLKEETITKHRINFIDNTIGRCDKLTALCLRDARAEAVAFLNGLHKALDIVWKELHK